MHRRRPMKTKPRPFRRPPRAEKPAGAISVRYSPAERAEMERLALAAGLDRSEWIRLRSLSVDAYDVTHGA